MCSLHRPNSLFEPINQRKVVSEASEKCLAKVYMGLHKSRQHCAPVCVDHLVGDRVYILGNPADPAIGYQQIAWEYCVLPGRRYQGSILN
jgi:hypothetical protein